MKSITPKEYQEMVAEKKPVKNGWKPQWAEIGGVRKYYRSKWEKNYALYLEWLKERGLISDWKHEPKTFWFDAIKRGTRSYLPDFEVVLLNQTVEYHEVKGWYDPKTLTKIKRMAKYHPFVKLVLIDGDWFKRMSKKLKALIPDWT